METDMVKFDTIELTAQRFVCSSLLAREAFIADPSQVQVELQYLMEQQAYMITTSFKAWGQQETREIASYPTTWWDHVKERLGWKHDRTVVFQQETLIYPLLPMQVAQAKGLKMRIATYQAPSRWDDKD